MGTCKWCGRRIIAYEEWSGQTDVLCPLNPALFHPGVCCECEEEWNADYRAALAGLAAIDRWPAGEAATEAADVAADVADAMMALLAARREAGK
ncbi:MAG: hypothetical protein IMZ50_16410 [Candidatus Atribacteria bacterium]|nr:hypothetical protein [Candidatus Atribacteria bacterium]